MHEEFSLKVLDVHSVKLLLGGVFRSNFHVFEQWGLPDRTHRTAVSKSQYLFHSACLRFLKLLLLV